MMLCLSACLVFTGCDKDKDNENPAGGVASKIEGTVVNGSAYDVDVIKGIVEERFEIASSDFANNKFSIDLPATLDDKHLESMFEDDMNINDGGVKGAFLDLRGYKSNKSVEYLEYARMPDLSATKVTFYYAVYVYVDRDANVTGEFYEEEDYILKFNMNLKKGWNLIYMADVFELISEDDYINTENYTTTPMSGYKWYFDAEDYFEEELGLKSASLKSSTIADSKSKMFQRFKK